MFKVCSENEHLKSWFKLKFDPMPKALIGKYTTPYFTTANPENQEYVCITSI